jgi:hypothetical protein
MRTRVADFIVEAGRNGRGSLPLRGAVANAAGGPSHRVPDEKLLKLFENGGDRVCAKSAKPKRQRSLPMRTALYRRGEKSPTGQFALASRQGARNCFTIKPALTFLHLLERNTDFGAKLGLAETEAFARDPDSPTCIHGLLTADRRPRYDAASGRVGAVR